MTTSIAKNSRSSLRSLLFENITKSGLLRLKPKKTTPKPQLVESPTIQSVPPGKPESGGYNEAFILERWASYECPVELVR